MALFAFWQDTGGGDALHARLCEEAHLVPERETAVALGAWRLSAWATATRFYTADAQLWFDPVAGEACVIHGLVWRGTRLLDAQAVAALLDRPGAALPGDVAGEYAIARLHRDGTLDAFSDIAGLHQLFHVPDRSNVLANRAGLAALIAGRREADDEAGLWLAAIGYRVGPRTGWAGVRQLQPGERLTGGVVTAAPRLAPPPGPRGFDPALLEEGSAQAIAAIRLAAGADGAVPLPITGGKDSRAVLALCLAAGLRDRLDLFTRGYEGHPDVAVGRQIAGVLGLPHRREAPLGSDEKPDWSIDRFVDAFARLAFQTDGGMGGWDLVTAPAPGRETLLTGHMGEVLKAYAKRAPEGVPDPIALVRLQAPFDPLDAIRPEATARLAETLAAGLDAERAAGAEPGDLPDLFYLRNRVPNWLGGIRGVKSFERQPVMPLYAPALMALAFRMTPEERRMERAHHALIAHHAPALLPIPFAHQRWHEGLGAPTPDPVLAPATMPLFGNWQFSLDTNPALRAFLADLFAATDVALWEHIDRARVLAFLREQRMTYFAGIGLLGLTVAVFHAAGLVRRDRIGGDWSAPGPAVPKPVVQRVHGHLDTVERGEGVTLGGWLHAPDWPGARPRVEAWARDRLVASAPAEGRRRDVAAAGYGDGDHGFRFTIDPATLDGVSTLEVTGYGRAGTIVGGTVELAP